MKQTAFVCFFLFALALSPLARAETKRPDIFLFLIDTLRADHLGAYGYSRKTSPNFDALAKEAIVFTNVRSTSSWTLPAVGSLFTSNYPTVHGLRANNAERWVRSLRLGTVTLAETLLAANYYSVSISANDWMKLEQQTGLERGFSVYEVMGPVTAERLNERARQHVVRHGDSAAYRTRPLFAYLHYMEPHLPWYAPKLDPSVLGPVRNVPDHSFTLEQAEVNKKWLEPAPFQEERWKSALHVRDYVNAYDETVYAWDKAFGAFVAWLKEKGRYDTSIIIVTADHGEELWEHGGFGHGFSLYEEAVRIPWVIRFPGGSPRGKIDSPLSLIDVAPTILAAVGLPVPPGMKGIDARKGVPQRPLFAEVDSCRGDWGSCYQRAVWKENQKLLMQGKDKGVRLYDLSTDPGEKKPGDASAELQGILHQWQKENSDLARQLGEGTTGQIDPTIQERLRQLGYE